MVKAFQTAVGFTEITTNQQSISTKHSPRTVHCFSVEINSSPFDWKWIVSTYCTKLLPPHSPAPETITHLTVCNCNTSFISLRCKYRKSCLNCSEFCRCDDCQSDEKDEFVKLQIKILRRIMNTDLSL